MTGKRWRVALVVNPIAGLGGAVGLKGSDGERAVRAIALGARPRVPDRVAAALEELRATADSIDWYAAGAGMGQDSLRAAGMEARVLHRPARPTGPEDTRRAAVAALEAGVDLLLFAGGDGTARDILAAIGERLPVLGIPAGVKMHSAVFAVTPRTAGAAVRRFLDAGAPARFRARREVMDREVTAEGEPASSPTLYGYLDTLQLPSLVQAAKASPGGAGEGAVRAAFGRLAEELRGFDVALLGPGATLRAFKASLGFDGSMLGVDVFAGGHCIIRDAREDQIREAIRGRRACLVLGVIGGQGFLLGRGNQQLSPRVLREIPRERIRVLASAEKLAALPASTLYVDTGDDDVDASLAGYLPVITGPRRSTLCRVATGADATKRDTPATGPGAAD